MKWGAKPFKRLVVKKPNEKNRVPEYNEEAIVDLTIEHPALGQSRAANELNRRDILVGFVPFG
jgi:hypothetical protein